MAYVLIFIMMGSSLSARFDNPSGCEHAVAVLSHQLITKGARPQKDFFMTCLPADAAADEVDAARAELNALLESRQ